MALINELHTNGKKVRAVNRAGTTDVPEGVEVIGGHATSDEFTSATSADAAVVYFCLNPPYTKWPELFPPLQSAVVSGSISAGAAQLESGHILPTLYSALADQRIPKTKQGQESDIRPPISRAAHNAGYVRFAVWVGINLSEAGLQLFCRGRSGVDRREFVRGNVLVIPRAGCNQLRREPTQLV